MNKIQHDFSKSAAAYDQHAHIQQEAADRLLARLQFFNNSPKRILDLGAGTGYCAQVLQAQYPNAQIVALDFAYPMCQISSQKNLTTICADLNQLPIRSNSFDLIVSNFTLQWCDDLALVFKQIDRICTPEGMFLFTTVGEGSLEELSNSFAIADGTKTISRVKKFVNLHQIGDKLLASGWLEPVIDVDTICHYYPHVHTLLREFKALGVTHKSKTRNKGMLGRENYQRFVEAYENLREPLGIPLSWQVVFGYARKQSGVQFGS